MGMSRDDSGSFLPNYTELDIIDANPFASVDQSGVGQLMEIGVKRGKSSRRGIKLGICGEHGGDPKSVEFCHKIGLNYVSCSPFRVPTARLATCGCCQLSNSKFDINLFLYRGSGNIYARTPFYF